MISIILNKKSDHKCDKSVRKLILISKIYLNL